MHTVRRLQGQLEGVADAVRKPIVHSLTGHLVALSKARTAAHARVHIHARTRARALTHAHSHTRACARYMCAGCAARRTTRGTALQLPHYADWLPQITSTIQRLNGTAEVPPPSHVQPHCRRICAGASSYPVPYR